MKSVKTDVRPEKILGSLLSIADNAKDAFFSLEKDSTQFTVEELFGFYVFNCICYD